MSDFFNKYQKRVVIIENGEYNEQHKLNSDVHKGV